MQYIDDTHYWGAEAAAAQVPEWESLYGKVPDTIYSEVLKRVQFQAGHASSGVMRHQWFTKMSGIPDAKGRVGRYPVVSRRSRCNSMAISRRCHAMGDGIGRQGRGLHRTAVFGADQLGHTGRLVRRDPCNISTSCAASLGFVVYRRQ